ncbi:MAG: acyl-CoA carboxylase subunit beta, partial [Emcibacter sp.]|nr:acyl-CoA carboxylase subunit beta [Emcibacter sp.]
MNNSMTIIQSDVNRNSPEYQSNQAAMAALVADLEDKLALIEQGGGEKYCQRHLDRGKLLPRDRVNRLLDKGSAFLEFSQLAAYDMYSKDVASTGVITGIGR